jgi:hypothetical protein
MNCPPKSLQAFAKACWFCTHPDVDGEDRSLLAFLAVNSDSGTGQNSRPGNVNLEVALQLKRRAIQRRVNPLVSIGLLEITERGDGRGNATTYRVVWESPCFPDQAPGGNREWLIVDKPRRIEDADSDDAEPKPRRVEDADSDLNRVASDYKPRRQEKETASSSSQEAPKPRRLGAATPVSPPKPTNPHTGEGGLEGWITNHCDQMGVPAESIKNILDGKVRAKGEANVVRALNKFLERPQGVVGLKSPWAMCLKELDVYLAVVDDANMVADREAKKEAAIQASIEQQRQELIQRLTPKKPNEGEVDPADIFG